MVIDIKDRVKCAALQGKIVTAYDAALLINPNDKVGISGFTPSGYAKAVPLALAERMEKEREKICLIAMLDTLEYLKKGGRISAAAAFAGGVLSIKPVVCIRDGEIVILGKARGSKQGNNLLVSEIRKTGGIDFTKPILLGYTGLDDTLLQKYIEDSKALWEEGISSLETTMIGSVIGTHAGPGAVAVAFFSV